jgi:hypothetical protein
VKENFLVSQQFRFPILVSAFGALWLASSVSCFAQNSGFNLDLHANGQATAKDIGLPAYPGAKPHKEGDGDSSSASLGLNFKDFHFSLLVASFETTDSGAKVLDYYRKPLTHYGEVLECFKGKPVGSLTVTKSGLTCDAKKGNNIEVNGSTDSSSDHELRAGTPQRYRIVGVNNEKDGKTTFGLVYLEVPKDANSKD